MRMREIPGFLSGTLRGRLILGVAAVHAVMMTLFVIDLTVRQRAMILDSQEEAATALAHSLSTSAAGWIAAYDLAGLQELVESQRLYPELIFAIIADENGCVLAHTDKSMTGKFLLDLPGAAGTAVMSKSPRLVDVMTPALLGGNHVGWVRMGIGQKDAREKLVKITLSGALYALAAILIGSVIAWRMGNRITRRLYAVQETINAVRAGDHLARSTVTGADEAALMGREFNAMLDALAAKEVEVNTGKENFRRLIEDSPLAMAVTAGVDNAVQLLNKKFSEVFGYTKEDIPDMARWWPLAYPEKNYRDRVMAEWFARVEKAVMTKKSMEPMEATVVCKDGSQRHIEFHMSAVDEGAMTTFIDITERKRAEKELQELRQRLEALIQERTAELEKKNVELEKMIKLFTGRELRMIELKEKIMELEEKKDEQ